MKENDYWERLQDDIKDKVDKGNIEEANGLYSELEKLEKENKLKMVG